MSLENVDAALQGMPYNTSMVTQVTNKTSKNKFQVNFSWEGFFKSILGSASQLINRALPSYFLNSNFNILSTNGTNTVTPADGSDFEFLKQWFVVNGGGANDYTLTPTPYANLPQDNSNSNYFLQLDIPTQDEAFYFYNLNYSTTGAFNSVAQFNSSPVAFSFAINNVGDLCKMWFSVYFSNTDQEFTSQVALLTPGFTNSSLSFDALDLTGLPYGPSDYAQVRCYFEQVDENPISLQVGYLKAEFSDSASYLSISPILENFLCNNLT